MSLFVLDAISWIFGVRAHIPGNDDFHGGRGRLPLATDGHRLMRILAVFAVVAVLLAWAAINLL